MKEVKNIVTIGGGTGSSAVLSGIRNIPGISITAVVSMADDGGSTGILRRELGVMPPGDTRKCLVALSEEGDDIKNMVNYRFSEGNLKGHNLGNMMLAALEKVTGDFGKSIEIISQILKVKGTVLPVTLDKAELVALLKDGQKIEGEIRIVDLNLKISDVDKIYYKNKVSLNPAAAKTIVKADYVIICPGAFHTSIAPNFIVEGFKEAFMKSKAKIIAIEDLDNTETNVYIKRLEEYLGKAAENVIRKDPALLSKEKVIKNPADLIKRSSIRHDSEKLAEIIAKIIK